MIHQLDFLIRYLYQNITNQKLSQNHENSSFSFRFITASFRCFLNSWCRPTLLINILLTLLGWLPGSIHAIWVIAKHEERMNTERRIY